MWSIHFFFFFFQAEDGIRDKLVTGVQTCALPILRPYGLISHNRASSGCSTPRPSAKSSDEWGGRRELRSRSEEHTSELQSLAYLVCRLLLEKKKTSTLTIILRLRLRGISTSCLTG